MLEWPRTAGRLDERTKQNMHHTRTQTRAHPNDLRDKTTNYQHITENNEHDICIYHMHTDALSFVSIQFYQEKMCVRLPVVCLPRTPLDCSELEKRIFVYMTAFGRRMTVRQSPAQTSAKVNHNSFDCMQILSMD